MQPSAAVKRGPAVARSSFWSNNVLRHFLPLSSENRAADSHRANKGRATTGPSTFTQLPSDTQSTSNNIRQGLKSFFISAKLSDWLV